MSINNTTLENIATLAGLNINNAQIAPLKKEMSAILDMIEQISNVNTEAMTPLSHPLETHQPLREDLMQTNNLKKEIQFLSDNIDNDLYIVPKVID